MTLNTLKTRLHTSNEREKKRQQEEAARQQEEAERQRRDEAVRETAELIAAAILASAPPPRAHTCEQPSWCLWCAPAGQAQKDAAIARWIGASEVAP